MIILYKSNYVEVSSVLLLNQGIVARNYLYCPHQEKVDKTNGIFYLERNVEDKNFLF